MNKSLNLSELDQLEFFLNRLGQVDPKSYYEIKNQVCRERREIMNTVHGRTHINPQTFDTK